MQRDRCIAASQICFQFIYRRVLAPAAELPWSLTIGDDLVGNLEDLAAGCCPSEPVSEKLWHLMHMPSFPKAQLVATLELMREVGWTNMPGEQQHASLSMLHRWHPGYNPETLVSRSLLLQMTRLLPSATKEEKLIATIMRRLSAIMASSPHKCTGRNMLVKSLVQICKGRKDAEQPGYEDSMDRIAKKCVTRHMGFWAAHSVAAQDAWRARARRHADERLSELSTEWTTLLAELTKMEGGSVRRGRKDIH